MRTIIRRAVGSAVIAALALPGLPAAARTPGDVADLVGARGSSGEDQLEQRGYVLADTRTGDERKWTHWWNRSSKECITVVTYDGRYESINSAPASDCNQKGKSGDTAAAVAVGAAALLGIAALASKSHNRDKYNDVNGTAEYERGYRDGLYNQSYHNYNRSDAYSSGYEQGTRQRGYETSYRPGYDYGGGYGASVYVNDLVGQSKGSATSALINRGFQVRDADKTEYDGRYTTWWRPASEQCITVNTRGGFVYTIQSVRPRNCR